MKVEKYLEEMIQEDYELEIDPNFNNNFDLDLVKGNYDMIKNHHENSNQIEIMNTFQQTFDDPNMHIENFDCDMENIIDIDYDLSLRK